MNTAERRARAALWSIRGVGPVTLAEVEARLGAPGELLERPFAQWAGAIEWRAAAASRLEQWGTLARVAEALEARCRATDQVPIFPGDEAWPPRLEGVAEAPPVLFCQGPGACAPPRRRVAFVGTRTPEAGALEQARALAQQAAAAGLGLVSGAALGVDQAAHRGALDAEGETWAFLGSALDQVDAAQRGIVAALRRAGGTVFSQFPPGCRSNQSTFTLRNALISGASDAVLVFRAPTSSGALYTAAAALRQGRPLLVTPGDPWNLAAAGSNALLGQGAGVCAGAADLLEAVGLARSQATPPARRPTVALGPLSPEGRRVLALLSEAAQDFEALEARAGLAPGVLSAALVELELAGAVLQRAGRRYEKC